MKKILIKRLIFTDNMGTECIGSVEFDGHLTDDNILGAFHEVGRTTWIGESLWTLRAGIPQYRVSVGTFYQYQKRWYELILDAVRRI